MQRTVVMPRKIQTSTVKPKVGLSPATERDSDMHGAKMNGTLWGLGLYQTFTRSFCHLLLKVATKELTAHRELFAV